MYYRKFVRQVVYLPELYSVFVTKSGSHCQASQFIVPESEWKHIQLHCNYIYIYIHANK